MSVIATVKVLLDVAVMPDRNTIMIFNRPLSKHWSLLYSGMLRIRRDIHRSLVIVITVLMVLVLTSSLRAQEFVPEEVVVPITDFKPDLRTFSPFTMRFGTGFCLDPACRFVGTNYHVAKIMGRYIRIKGVFSAHRYLGTDPFDVQAKDVDIFGAGTMKYTPAHDLAIYEMRRPLKNMHGAIFDTEELNDRREIDIYGYPFSGNPKRGLVCWHGKFVGHTPEGLLAFSYEEGRVHGGASGGIVVDSKTRKVLGILNGLPASKERTILAVPVKELSDFVRRRQPYLQAAIFPTTVFISPVGADLYEPYVWPGSNGLSQRPMEAPEVVKLRLTAQSLADSMRNFTAVQTFAWGRGNRSPEMTDAFETLIVDGWQRWRRPGSKKLYDRIPFPAIARWVVPAAEWSQLPEWVGTELNLKIHQAPDAVLGDKTIHVFQYAAKAEDKVCRFEYVFSLSYFLGKPPKSYDCHGEVWLDESGTILRISETFELSRQGAQYRGVVTYGWLEKDGTQHLVPVTIVSEYDPLNVWCRGLFTDYDMFSVKSHIILPTTPGEPQSFDVGAQ
jgi:hypothetical protein